MRDLLRRGSSKGKAAKGERDKSPSKATREKMPSPTRNIDTLPVKAIALAVAVAAPPPRPETYASKMKAFRGSVRKKIAELEAGAGGSKAKGRGAAGEGQGHTKEVDDAREGDITGSSEGIRALPPPPEEEEPGEDTVDNVASPAPDSALPGGTPSMEEPQKGDDQQRQEKPNEATPTTEEESDAESIYESRRLLAHRMMKSVTQEVATQDKKSDPQQGQDGGGGGGGGDGRGGDGSDSEVDSWADLEENFSKVFEPIPQQAPGAPPLPGDRGPVAKRTVSRSEILRQMELRENQLASSSGPPYGLLPGMWTPQSLQQVVAEVHAPPSPPPPLPKRILSPGSSETESEFGETDYVTRSELYRNIRNLQDSLARHGEQKATEEDSQSWRSVPSNVDEPVYISRSEILSRMEPTYGSRPPVGPVYGARPPVEPVYGYRPIMEPVYGSRAQVEAAMYGSRPHMDSAYVVRAPVEPMYGFIAAVDPLPAFAPAHLVYGGPPPPLPLNGPPPYPGVKDKAYVSRSEILSRLREMRESEDERGLSPTQSGDLSTSSSSWDLCSCASCEQCGGDAVRPDGSPCQCGPHERPASAPSPAPQQGGKTHQENGHPPDPRSESPSDQSVLSYDSWSVNEFEKGYEPVQLGGQDRHVRMLSLTLEEQERRLKQLAKAEGERRAAAGLEMRRSGPVDSWSLSEAEDVYESLARVSVRRSIREKLRNADRSKKSRESEVLELQRRVREILGGQAEAVTATTKNRIIKVITEHIQRYFDLTNIEDEDERNQEIRDRLKEAMAQDWERLSNINLGLIYVPMEDNPKNSKIGSREATDYDTFGSIDSLIFEPKVPTGDDITEASDEGGATPNISGSTTADGELCVVVEGEGESEEENEMVEDEKGVESELEERDTSSPSSQEGKEGEEEEEEEEETPVPTPIPSTPEFDPESASAGNTSSSEEVEHPDDGDRDDDGEDVERIRETLQAATEAAPTRHPQSIGAVVLSPGGRALQDGKPLPQEKASPTKTPLKQKIYRGLMGLGFKRFGSKELLKSSPSKGEVKSALSDGGGRGGGVVGGGGREEESLAPEVDFPPRDSQPSPLLTKLQRQLDLRQDEKDLVNYETVDHHHHPRLMASDSRAYEPDYDYHPDHREPFYHGGTSTTHDTATIDSEDTESVTSFESVIFRGSGCNDGREPSPLKKAADPPKDHHYHHHHHRGGEERKRRNNPKRHKYVVNQGPDSDGSDHAEERKAQYMANSDGSDRLESKSPSTSTQPYLDSDTSWDYMEGAEGERLREEEEVEHEEEVGVEEKLLTTDLESVTHGPRVVGNLRRKHAYHSMDNIERTSPPSSVPSEQSRSLIDCEGPMSSVEDVGGCGDSSFGTSGTGALVLRNVPKGGSSSNGDLLLGGEDLDGRLLFRAYQRRQFRPPSDVSRKDSCTSQEADEYNVYEECMVDGAGVMHPMDGEGRELRQESDGDGGGRDDEDGNPPVVLLKHHVYQSIESLASRSFCDRGSLASRTFSHKPADGSSDSGEPLHQYGSRNGEPIYGACNSRLFHCMNGAYVRRDVDGGKQVVEGESPVIIRNGQVVELTEEMFKGTLERKEAEKNAGQLSSLDLDSPSSDGEPQSTPLLPEVEKERRQTRPAPPPPPPPQDLMGFTLNTNSSSESKLHTYENDSEIYGTRQEIRQEMMMLRSSQQQEDVEVGVDKRTVDQGGNGGPEGSVEVASTAAPSSCDTADKIKKAQKIGVAVLGNMNNDLMIRELKLKLRRRFNPDGAEDEHDSGATAAATTGTILEKAQGATGTASLVGDHASAENKSSVASTREQLAPHMNKIFGSLYEKRRQTLELKFGGKLQAVDDDGNEDKEAPGKGDGEAQGAACRGDEGVTGGAETRTKEREVLHIAKEDGEMEEIFLPTPDYTPLSTLPRNSKRGGGDDEGEDGVELGICPEAFLNDNADFSFDMADIAKYVHEHMTRSKESRHPEGETPPGDAATRGVGGRNPLEDDAFLVSQGLKMPEDVDESPKRVVRFDTTRRLEDFATTWSDLESVIFAEEEQKLQQQQDSEESAEDKAAGSGAGADGGAGAIFGGGSGARQLPSSRMQSYKDDWLLWDQMAKMRRSKAPEDRERWELEKTKRMLLWIHLSNNNNHTEWCYRSQWWRAKQKASVRWIVQKAHKNKVPSDLQDPYYNDYEGQEHLKPGIVHRLANADLYCSALANIYSDPNFHNLSHWGIIQALARKGVYVAEPTDVPFSETVLIQVAPIKMSAHLAVIEAMMALYIREVVMPDRVVATLQRISMPSSQTPQDQEEALVVWINSVTQALQEKINQHVQPSQDQELPIFPRIQDLSDLSDGIGLSALIAFYCPEELSWADIAVGDTPSIADSLYNIGLVMKFCHDALPYNPCLLTKEDIVYMHSSVKQNVLAFCAELFFLFELEPVSCVSLPGTKKSSKLITLSSPGGGCSGWSGYQRGVRVIPDLRQSRSPSSTHSTASSTHSSTHSSSAHSYQRSPCSTLRGEEEGACGGFNWGALYPQWWWSCNHEVADRDCIYCWRQHQSQPFGDQYTYYLNCGQPTSHGQTGQSVAQNLLHPYREHKSAARVLSCHSVMGPHPSSYAMKPAGAPSVRRSHSMNLNDVTDFRQRSDQKSDHAPSSYNSEYGGRDSSMSDGQEGDFVVQRSKGLTTLNDMLRTHSPHPSQDSDHLRSKDRYSMDNMEEEMAERASRLGRRGSFHNSTSDVHYGPKPPAGLPSRWDESRGQGRSRSRRNSVNAEDSQLTIENFGGSQDNLNYISRNPDKDLVIHSGKRDSGLRDSGLRDNRDSRDNNSRAESRGSRERSLERRLDLHRPSLDELDNRVVEKLERDLLEREKRELTQYRSKEVLMVTDPRKGSVEVLDSGSESDVSYERDKLAKATSFAELSKLKEQLPGGINIIYMQSDKEEGNKKGSKKSEKKTTFAALPNQTTWKQQSVQSIPDDSKPIPDENVEPQVMASELHNVRLKLEEKRRRIESEKRKMELAMNKQRQKLGKEAFMQAVVKGGKGSSTGSSTPTTSEPDTTTSTMGGDMMVDSMEQSLPKASHHSTASSSQANPNLSLKDIDSDVSKVSHKWLESQGQQQEELKTPDIESMDYDEYHKSLTHLGWLQHRATSSRQKPTEQLSRMTDSLTEIQSDIHRLNQQQHQIQSLIHNGMNTANNTAQQNQFYLHDQQMFFRSTPTPPQQGSPGRRMWGQQSSGDGYTSSMSPATRRAQWGPVRPMVPQGDYMMGQHPNYYPQYPMAPHGQMQPTSGAPPPSMAQMGALQQQQQQQQQPQGFMLHGQAQSLPPHSLYQNGQGYYSPEHQYRGYPAAAQSYASGDQSKSYAQPHSQAPFRLHGDSTEDQHSSGSLRSSAKSSPSRQPHPSAHQKSPSPSRQSSISHAPVAAPPPDDMEPQNVSFIASQQDQADEMASMSDRLKKLNITSGSRTYRVHEPSSPTRPHVGIRTFRVPTKKGTPVHDDVDLPQPMPPQRSISPPYNADSARNEDNAEEIGRAEPLQDDKADKGFYISFDDDTGPKRPKPQLRNKRLSQRKSSTPSTPLSTPSKEESPVFTERPSQTSNGSWEPERPSMFPVRRPSMSPTLSPQAQSPTGNASLGHSPSGVLYPQMNGLYSKDSEGAELFLQSTAPTEDSKQNTLRGSSANLALVIGDDLVNPENTSMSQMEKKKELLMLKSLRRKQEQEETRRVKEYEAQEKRNLEKMKEEEKIRKKEEEKSRREAILERYKIKKAIEEAEKEGRYYEPPPGYNLDSPGSSSGKSSVRLRSKTSGGTKPRPKTMIESRGSYGDITDGKLMGSGDKKGSSHNLAGDGGRSGSSSAGGTMRKSSGKWGSSHSLSRASGSRGSTSSLSGDCHGGSATTTRTLDRGHTGRRPNSVLGGSSTYSRSRGSSLFGSRAQRLNSCEEEDRFRVHEARRPSLALERAGHVRVGMRRGLSSQSLVGSPSHRKYRSTGNLSGQSEHDSLVYHGLSEDSGLGRSTPPRRAPSPGMSRHLPSPSGPGSLPPGLFSKRRPGVFDDNASDISSTTSSTMDYSGPRLYKQPAAKSNRTIILNSVEYCVFPGVVNQTAKHRVLEEIARSESKHFLILFRDAGCQFRALYSFNPETEEVYKLYGTGPKQVTDRMYDKFFKYNSGGKCFTQIHTKHLTVTIDAFTIHNSLWQGKKVNLPSKKDMTLVI
ncbi:calmodulin-regulated spectrin-associated protein patronin isoform X3 [Oratosquilla oratoria]|uniref:calmodulin-regulated spectrin-associated protein patronin isoform X3 n=1 Tax=Oratosquilla oratoria TaxID=337810 RepID=UPI003F772444